MADAGRSGRSGSGRPVGRARADSPGARTASRPGQRSQPRPRTVTGASEEPEANNSAGVVPRLRQGLRMTQRAIILGVVMVVLLVSYATTLRVYFNQQSHLAQARQQIAEHEASITELSDEVERWNDPAYVKIQARERLGWVVPGETGYRVIGPDGQPYGGGSQIGSAQLPEGEYAKTWWDRMWGSVAAADDPEPVDEPVPDEPIRAPEPEEGP
ncbi:MAG: FtsB family cell division protein [Brooklawnia sp.]|jgi:cell division protein FtsB